MKPTMRGRSWSLKLILLLTSGVCLSFPAAEGRNTLVDGIPISRRKSDRQRVYGRDRQGLVNSE